ncbi:unnamed protein product, partial [Prorocentrum cordatum]
MSGDSGEEGERCQGRAELVWEGLGGRFFGARAPWLVHRGRIVRFSVQPPRLSTLCIQALQKKLSLNSAKLSGRLGTSPALLATGASRPHPGAPDRPEARPREHTCDPGRRGLRHGRRRRRGRP